MSAVPRIGTGLVLLSAIAGLGALALLLRLLDQTETPAPTTTGHATYQPPADDFVGSEACAKCHAQVYDLYMTHPMANTMNHIDVTPLPPPSESTGDSRNAAQSLPDSTVFDSPPAVRAEDYRRATFTAGTRNYQAVVDNTRVLHHESMIGDDGECLFDQSVEVQYAVGAGVKARSFLINRDGLLFQSPMTWYTRKQIWDLSPGYKPRNHARFDRRITDSCLSCHAGRVDVVDRALPDRFQPEPFLEMSIGCERCHGPGRRHIEKLELGNRSDSKDLLIINPERLEPHLRDSVCNQCHLEGKMRVLRPGRTFHDFRPGRPLEDFWTVFVGDSPIDSEGRALFTSHVEQMHDSACYKGSGGLLGCISCHDAHAVPGPAEKVSFYRQRCGKCHAENACSLPHGDRARSPASNSCIHCHMPMIASHDVTHTIQADHRVVRVPQTSSGPATSPSQAVEDPWRLFGSLEHTLPAWELKRARALALFRQGWKQKDRHMLAASANLLISILREHPDDVEVLRTLGNFHLLRNDIRKGRHYFERVLESKPQDEWSLARLGLLCQVSSNIVQGLEYLERLLKLNPWDREAYPPYAKLLSSTGQLDKAIEAAERGLELNPTVSELRKALVEFYREAGRLDESHRQEVLIKEIGSRSLHQ